MDKNLKIIALIIVLLILNVSTGRGQSADPDFVLNTYALDFGDVTIGDSVLWKITVTNAGILNNLSITGVTTLDGFTIMPSSLASLPIELPPGSSQDFDVIFKPLSNNVYSGDIIFSHNALSGTTILSVTGSGQIPDPDFSLNHNSVNFGVVKIGESVTQSISVTNNGVSNTLAISGIASTVGYNVVPNPAASYPLLVEPGATQNFDIVFSPASDNTFSGTILFEHNAFGGSTKLEVTGSGRLPDQNFILSTLSLNFGTVSVGRNSQQTITVSNSGLLDTLVVTGVTPIEGFSITPNPSSTYPLLITPGTSKTFDVVFTPNSGLTFSGNIVFAHNAAGGTSDLSVTGNGHVPDQSFVLNNTLLDFGDVTIGDSVTWSVTVTNTGVIDTLIIHNITSIAGYSIHPNPIVTYPVAILPGGSQNFNVVFSPPSSSSFSGNIIFTHNAPGGTTNLAVSGIGHESDQKFTLSAGTLNFGDVILGESASQSVTVTNSGEMNSLTISGVSSMAGYTIVPDPLTTYPVTLVPGASQNFVVTFTPISDTVSTGSIVFTHTAPGGTTNLVVSGSGLVQGGIVQFSQSRAIVFDDSSSLTGAYTETLDLVNYSGRPLKALQCMLVSRGKIRVHSIFKTGIFASSNWLLSTTIKHGPSLDDGTSIDTFNIVLLGLGATELVPPATVHMFTFTYDAIDITSNRDSTTLGISGLIGSTSGTITRDAQITAGPDQTVIIKNRVQWGDVNSDGDINIIDLFRIVRHITGEAPLTGNNFEAADVAPWIAGAPAPTREPVPVVNVLDLSQLQHIVLTGVYPDSSSASSEYNISTAPFNAVEKSNNSIHVKIHVLSTGIFVRVLDTMYCRGVQLELVNLCTNSTDVNKYSWGSSCMRNNSVRMLVMNEEGSRLPSGIIASIPMKIDNPSMVTVRLLKIVGDQGQLVSGESEIRLSPVQSGGEMPTDFRLGQNYPNPFNPSTKITVSIPRTSQVRLVIYNMLGQEVAVLINRELSAGIHQVEWNGIDYRGNSLASGTYIYRLVAEKFIATKKMVLLK